MAKRKVGELFGKPIVQGEGDNTLTVNEIEIKENNNKYILNKRDPSGEVESITNKGSDINIFENFIYLYFNKNDTDTIIEFALYSMFFIFKNL